MSVKRPRRRAHTPLPVLAAWTAWRWRLETLLVVLLAATYALFGPVCGITLTLAAAHVAPGPVRRRIINRLHIARVKRDWTKAVIQSGAADPPGQNSRRPATFFGPRATRVQIVNAGDLLTVKVAPGTSVKQLENRTAELAAGLEVREVRVVPDRTNARKASVLLVRHDPFHDAEPITWPHHAAARLSLWEPLPLGVDEEGRTFSIELVERNMLIGGEPGAGKSVALSLFAATAALDPDTRLWLLDGKEVELAAWAPCAERSVGPDPADAIRTLKLLHDEMATRYRDLLKKGLRKIEQDADLPLHIVLVDELAFYLQHPPKKQCDELTELLRDLVARGRAAGIIVIAATQKPSVDVIPSKLRDLFGFRFALRCNTPQASDTILGQGWATDGNDASTIPGGQRGVGFLLAEQDRPMRIRGFHLSDSDVRAVSERGASLRANTPPAVPDDDGLSDA
jgi:hypothetical protein